MSNEKIIEALTCCSGNVDYRDCESCPYFNERRCIDKMLEHAAEAIHQIEVKKS